MLGALIIAIVLVVGIPVAVMVSGGVMSAILGWSLKETAETNHEGSELIDLNV